MTVAGHHVPVWYDEATGPTNGQGVFWNATTKRWEAAEVDISALDTAGLATDAALTAETNRATTAEGLKLTKASNLSDVASAATALANLGGQASIPPGTYAVPADVIAEASARADADALKAPIASPTFTGTVTAPVVGGTTDFTGAARFKSIPYADVTGATVAMLGNDALDNASKLATVEPLAQEQFYPAGTYRFGSAVMGADKSLATKATTLLTSGVSNAVGPYTTASFTTLVDAVTIIDVAHVNNTATTAPAPTVTDSAGRVWDLIATTTGSTLRLSQYRTMTAGTGTVTFTFGNTQTVCRWHITQTTNVPTGANGANAVGVAVTSATAAITGASLALPFTGFGAGMRQVVAIDANVDTVPGFGITEITDGGGGSVQLRMGSSWSKNPVVPSISWSGSRLGLFIAVELKGLTTTVVGNAGRSIKLQYGATIKPTSGEVVQIAGRIDPSITWQIFDESLGGRVVLAWKSLTARVRPEWWGAVGDGLTDDSASVRAAKFALRGRGRGGKLVFQEDKTYLIDCTNDPLTNPLHFDAQFAAVSVHLPLSATLRVKTNALTTFQTINLVGVNGFALYGGGTLYGDLETHTYATTAPHATNQYGHHVQILGGSNIRVRDVELTKAWGDGVYQANNGAERPTDIRYENVNSHDNRREAFGIMDGTGVWLVNCKGNDSGLWTHTNDPAGDTGPRSGLDIEPNASEYVEDLWVVGCQFVNNGGRGINATGEAYGVGSKRWFFIGGECKGNGWAGGGSDDGAAFGYVTELFVQSYLFQGNLLLGLLITGSVNGSIANCRSMENGSSGFRVDQLPAGYRVSFAGCRSIGNASYGWDLGPGVGGGDVIVDFLWSEGNATAGGLEDTRITGSVRIDGGRIRKGTDEIQQVTITGTPTGGTLTLTFEGQTTSALARNATAATVQTALEALSSVGAGNAVVTGGPWPGTAMRVRFTGTLASTNRTQMTATSSLTGGVSPAVAVSTLVQGGGAPTYLLRVNANSTAQIRNLDGVGTGTTGAVNDLATGTVMAGCTGTLASESIVTATVTSGATTVTVNHGLAKTPTYVDLTATNSMGSATKAWVTAMTSTQFTVNVNIDPGATTATFNCHARVSA